MNSVEMATLATIRASRRRQLCMTKSSNKIVPLPVAIQALFEREKKRPPRPRARATTMRTVAHLGRPEERRAARAANTSGTVMAITAANRPTL